MDEAIQDYIESHQDEIREDYAEYLSRYSKHIVNAEVDFDDIKVDTIYQCAEDSFTNWMASKEDDAYDAWKDQQMELQDESK